MRRRDFISLIGGAGATWPLAARAQQPTMPVIGFLSGNNADRLPQFTAAFHEGLSAAGFVDGKNVVIEYRWADSHLERVPALALDFDSASGYCDLCQRWRRYYLRSKRCDRNDTHRVRDRK